MAKLLDGTRIYGTANVDTRVNVGANLYANTTTLFVGNSTVNTTVNSSTLSSTSANLSSTLTAGGIVSGSELTSTNASGDEGGQVNLAKPPNATTDGGVTIDAYQNRVRIFEQGGNARGVYIDLTACANGVGTNLLAGGGGGGSVNTSAQYTWTNTHTFQANVNFTGNNITVVSNTGSVMFGGAGDTNWRIGRSTGSTTKFYYSNNTLDILAAASNLEGVVIGQPGGNTYLETGYAGTFTKNPIYVGNSTVNATINSTSFTGTSNNASYLGGTAAANFIQNTDSRTLSGNLYFTGSNNYFDTTVFVGNSTATAIVANTTGLYPASNTVGQALGATTSRWAITGSTGTFSSTLSVTGAFTVGAAGVVFNAAGSNINATALTTGSVNFGGVTQTGSILLGQSTANQTVLIANGATTSGNVKTISIGENGTAGSQTNITIGSSLSNTLITVNANNTTISGNLTIASTGELVITSGAGIYANGSLGTANQVLTTNGTSVYWANSSGGGGFTNGQSISVNNFVLTGSFTANSSTGSAGQFLLSSNTSAYWQSVSLLSVYYSNGSLAFEATGTGVSGGGGATGSGGDQVFYENDITITTNYTISTNKNAMTAGPITINSGVTVTVPSGSVWTIV